MSIHKDKKRGTWYVKFQNKTKRGFQTKVEAQKYEAQQKLGFEEGPKETEAHKTSIDEVAQLYLKTALEQTEYGSYTRSKYMIETFILPNFHFDDIFQITELDCLKLRNFIGQMEYSTVYKNTIIGIFKQVMKTANKYYKLNPDPSYVVERFKKTRQEKVEQRNRDMNIWTIDEFTRFIDKVKSRKHKLFFSVLYFTGLRLGEALALKWADLNDESISVNKSITRKTNKGSFEIKEPKTTSSIRNVKVNKSLYLSLINFKTDEMKCEGFKEDWFIFNREKPLSQSHLDRVKDRAIAEADLKRIRIHDLRHSHASNLISEGISIVAVSRRLGHSNIDMTLRVYTHLLEKNDEQLINFIEDSSHNLLTTI